MTKAQRSMGFRSILIATDFSAGATQALKRGLELPRVATARIHLLHVIPVPGTKADLERLAKQQLARAVTSIQTSAPSVLCRRSRESLTAPSVRRRSRNAVRAASSPNDSGSNGRTDSSATSGARPKISLRKGFAAIVRVPSGAIAPMYTP